MTASLERPLIVTVLSGFLGAGKLADVSRRLSAVVTRRCTPAPAPSPPFEFKENTMSTLARTVLATAALLSRRDVRALKRTV
ncbi:hypothetical protein [Deinococcus marmoris]|uniref:hypothetical protein n=1 Tax=Deinococcus marmoris TaxID=249408 RepID=UPI0004985055|nr:hypothetical protein [Deinococcus marmoris]